MTRPPPDFTELQIALLLGGRLCACTVAQHGDGEDGRAKPNWLMQSISQRIHDFFPF
jgi:hypothetical protein